MIKLSYAMAAVTVLLASSAYAHPRVEPARVKAESAYDFAPGSAVNGSYDPHSYDSDSVVVNGRYVGQDPDANVRLEMRRDQLER